MKQGILGRLSRGTLALLVAAGLALSGCSLASNTSPVPNAQEAGADGVHQDGYTARQVPVFREELTDEHATMRFYDDMPSVAYINVVDFYKLMLPQGTMDVTVQEDGTWRLESHTGAKEDAAMENGRGGTAVVDPAAGTITSPNLAAFVNTMSNLEDGMDNVYYDGTGIVRVSSVEYDRPADPTTIDLAKYGIVARGDDGGLWLPVHTLSTLFMNLHYDYVMYNGQKLYVNEDNSYRPLEERDPGFGDAFFAQPERADDMIAFDYGQFCLAFDVFYGKPACMPEVLKTQGLDAYLTSLGDEGRAVKDALMSKDYAMYLHGCDGLGGAFAVDGHTMIDIAGATGLGKSKAHEDLYKRYQALGKKDDDPINRLVAKDDAYNLTKNIIQLSCKEQSHKAFGDETYVKKGDTAVIVLDSFDDVDFQGWEDFLAGKGPRPSGSEAIEDESSPSHGNVDSLGIFLDGLDKAKADPEVRNVVFDVTKNDGGSDDVVLFASSLIANRSHERFQNTLTGQTVTERFDVDRNLDGTFDQKDAAVDYSDLNFAVLTSGYGYSCGNQFPCLLKDAGIPIIGEKTDGGSCSVQKQVTGEGIAYSHSSWLSRLINDEGEEIDFGVPVDVDLLERAGSSKELRTVDFDGKHMESEVYDYSSFFDIDNLSQVMNEIYGSSR